MGLGNFFSKSKAKSIEVNGVKYSAPKDGICSLKVEEGKVFVNGEDATKEIIEKSPIPKASSKKEIPFDGHLIQLDVNNEDCQDKVFLEDNSLKVTKDLIANLRYDSSKANNIYVGGTFMGKISDTSSTPLDSWADITIKGKANGEIHTITQGDIRIGEE